MRSVGFDNVRDPWPVAADGEDAKRRRQESARVIPRPTDAVSNWTLACACLSLERWPQSEKQAA